MKWFIIICIIIVIFFYTYEIYNDVNNMDFYANLNGVDFSKFNLNSFASGGSVAKITITVTIVNNGSIGFISFNNLILNLIYNGFTIFQTSDNKINSGLISILANSTTKITQEFNVLVNSGLTQLVSDIISGKNVEIDYTADLKWHFMSIPTISGSFCSNDVL